ncbi:MAG TPA: 5'-nucleotidase C-terminal domain-containing protein [Vicingus sp.]|nr:5'-nucleotidase C-terminal domain-containing protein [Flavobacteriales bacterium]HRN40663.1 5'-nucleotidase C-terminal domain-containing protein [Vicingus sp.]
MNKKIFHIISFVVGFTLIMVVGCKSSVYHPPSWNYLTVDSSITEHQQAKQLIEPYKNALDSEMNEVLVFSAMEFPKEKNKPETLLGNLVADLSLEIITKKFPETKIDFCLLNNGGLRTSLPKGEITRGKIFELMPFDNELVIVTITENQLINLINYIKKVGGQPISAISFDFSTTENNDVKQLFEENGLSSINILTSDYLAQGGDNMNFFLNPVKYETTGIKLRDAIIAYCISEHKKGNKLNSKLDGRIRFE